MVTVSLPLRLITGNQIIKPFLKQGDVSTVENVPEHIAVLAIILLDFRRMDQWHNGIGIALKVADLTFLLLTEAHVRHQVEVRGDAQSLMCPNVEIVLVSPIGSLVFLETVEPVGPLHFLLVFLHIRINHLLETLFGILVHG